MKIGIVNKNLNSWSISYKNDRGSLDSIKLSLNIVKSEWLKDKDTVSFRIFNGQAVDVKKCKLHVDYTKNPLSYQPGGVDLTFIFNTEVQTVSKIKYPKKYIETVLLKIKNEPKVLILVTMEPDTIIWEDGKFVN